MACRPQRLLPAPPPDRPATAERSLSRHLGARRYSARRTGIARLNGVATAYGYGAASRLDELDQNLVSTANDLALDFARNPASQLITREASNNAYTYVPATGTTAYTNNGRNQVTAGGGDHHL